MVAQKSSVLFDTKETKHKRYHRSEKGQARNYRRNKKRLADRILIKQDQITQLEKELLNESKNTNRNGTS